MTDTTQNHSDEIDLVELISSLWKEKITIIVSTVVVLLIGIAYLLTTKPIYEARIQIQAPAESQLAPLNNTQIIAVTQNQAFSQFLSILESDAHRNQLIEKERDLLAKLYGIAPEDITTEATDISLLYKLNYPNLKKQENSLEPDIYTITIEGSDRLTISELLNKNINLAADTLSNEWEGEFESLKKTKIDNITSEFDLLNKSVEERRANTITRLTEENLLQRKKIQDELVARKSYVLNSRKDRITELEEALKIASALNIIQPSTLSRMATQSTSRQVEVNTEIRSQQDPLYLRGSKLLAAELENLKALSKTTFLDSRIIELETELQQLKTNREVEILKARKSDIAFNEKLQTFQENLRKLSQTQFPQISITFENSGSVSPQKPISPKKPFVLAISILLGGMIGFFIAIGRIIYKNYKAEKQVNVV